MTTSASAAPAAPTTSTTSPGTAAATGWTAVISVGQGRAACPQYFLCIWTGENYTGSGRGYGGSIAHGDGVSWFNTVWENNVHSAVNQTTIPVTFLDIHGTTGIELGDLYPGYDFHSGWPGANKADGIYYR
nr:peptidase inhibitor family I36 protein [Streptomyces sp. SID13726]